jgi:hypothetical protein
MSLAAESWDFDAVDRFYRTAETLYEDHDALDDDQMDAQAANLAGLWEDAYEQVSAAARSYLSSFEGDDSLEQLRSFFIEEEPEEVRGIETEIPDEVSKPSEALEKYFRAEELAAEAAGEVRETYDIAVEDEIQAVPVETYIDAGLM